MKQSWLKKKLRISTLWFLIAAFLSTSVGLYHYFPEVSAFIGGRQNRGAASVLRQTRQAAPRLGENAQAYFPFDGDATNKVTNSRTNLTDNATVTQVADETKKAAQFTAANNEYLSAADSDALTPSGDFTIAAWVNLDTRLLNQEYPTGWQTIVSKDEPGEREYSLYYDATDNMFRLMVSYDSDNYNITGTANGVTPTAGTWYLLVGWFNPTANTIHLSVNNATASTQNIDGDNLTNGTATLEVGKMFTATDQWYLGGKVDEIGLWDRALTSDERTELYNSGNGITYSQMSSGLKSGVVSYWTLDETSGTRTDKVGTNQLTDNNTVTSATAKVPIRSSSAAQFTRANSEYLSAGNTADLTTGDIDFSIATWVYMDSKPADFMNIFGKWGSGGNEYTIDWSNTADRFRFVVSVNGGASSFGTVTANNLGAPSLDTWYFIVAWHDSVNNQIGIQINNGTADTTSYSSGVYASTSGLRIGSLTSGTDRFWDGRIDDTAFWRRTLTATEKTALYNSGNGTTYTNVAPAFKDDLMAWWTLDEASGTRNDSHSNQPIMTTPTVASGVTQTLGKIGYGYDFPGTSGNYITVANNDAINFTSNLSIALWVYMDTTNTTVWLHKGNGSTNTYQMAYINDGTIQLCIANNCAYSDSTGLTAGKWYHVAVTFDTTENKQYYYVNGVAKGSDDQASNLSSTSTNLTIGSIGGSLHFDGKFDEIRFYNGVLSSSNVTALVNGPTPPECDNSCKIWYRMDESSGTSVTDYSGNANTGTASAATLGIAGGPLGLAGDFASSRKITGASDFPLTSLTAMAWINPTTCPSGASGSILSKGDGGSPSGTDFIFNIGETSCTTKGSVLGAYVNSAWKQGTTTISNSTWTHVAMTYDGSNVRFYINGTIDGSAISNSGSIANSSGVAYVGIQGSGLFNPFNGLIDDARIYNRRLTDAEIKDYYLKTRPL